MPFITHAGRETYIYSPSPGGLARRRDGRAVRATQSGGFEVENLVDTRWKDRNGNVVAKSPIAHRHDYDTFVRVRIGTNNEIKHTISSSDLYCNDYQLHDKLTRKYFGNISQQWETRDPHLIEQFIKEYFRMKKVRLLLVEQGCNAKNGFPFWLFSIDRKLPRVRKRVSLKQYTSALSEIKEMQKQLELLNMRYRVCQSHCEYYQEGRDRLKTNVIYAHSNLRGGNVEEALKYIQEIREMLPC